MADGEYSGKFKPSTDTASHIVIYRELDWVNSVVHTHSTFCTAFAACGKHIPVILTATADEFGDIIPCTPYCEIGGEDVGKAVVAALRGSRAGAVLIRNHGLFTVGESLEEAVKRAVMAEDCARTTWYATRSREYILLKPDQTEDCFRRYHEQYGQK
jgi:L-ribulose-5-phosphate 4-epimerase